MDAFTRRIDPEDSFDVGDDFTNSFDLTQSSMSSSSFGVNSPGGAGSDVDVDTNAADRQPSSERHTETEYEALQTDFKYRHRPLYEAPEFVRRLNVFEEVDIDGTVTFECQVRAFPRPIIKWYKDDEEVPISEPPSSADVIVNRVQAEDLTGKDPSTEGLLKLIIRDARKEDEGAYRCKAENEEGVAATTGYLSVTGGPASSQSDNGSSQQQQPSPRINAVSTPPLLRAITEQQSMEEREAAFYVENDSAADDDDDVTDNFAARSDPDVPILSSVGDWSSYLQQAIDEDNSSHGVIGMQNTLDSESGSDTSCELEDTAIELKIVESETNPPANISDAYPLSATDQLGVASSQAFEAFSMARDLPDSNEYLLTEASNKSRVNVVVVEGDNPEESSVAAAVIGDRSDFETTSVDEPIESLIRNGDDTKTHSTRVSNDESATQVENECGIDRSADALLLSTPPEAVDSLTNDISSESSPAAVVGTLASVKFEVADAADVAVSGTQQLSDDYISTQSDGLTDPEKGAIEDESLHSDPDVKSNANCSTTPSTDHSFSFGGLLRDIFPNSAKPDKRTAAIEESLNKQTFNDETVDNRSLTSELPSDDRVSATGDGEIGKTAATYVLRKQICNDAELTWSHLYDWYVGWLEYPWIIYAAAAMLFTLAAVAGEVDPPWVIITVLAASFVMFVLFPVPRPPVTDSESKPTTLTSSD